MIIECHNCRQKNRIPDSRNRDGSFRCGKCKIALVFSLHDSNATTEAEAQPVGIGVTRRRRFAGAALGIVYGTVFLNGFERGLLHVLQERAYDLTDRPWMIILLAAFSAALAGFLATVNSHSIPMGLIAGITTSAVMVPVGLAGAAPFVWPGEGLAVIAEAGLAVILGILGAFFGSRYPCSQFDLSTGSLYRIDWKHWLWLWLPWNYTVANAVWLSWPGYISANSHQLLWRTIAEFLKAPVYVGFLAFGSWRALLAIRKDSRYSSFGSAARFVGWFALFPIILNLTKAIAPDSMGVPIFIGIAVVGRFILHWRREAAGGFGLGRLNAPMILWSGFGQIVVWLLGQALFWGGAGVLLVWYSWHWSVAAFLLGIALQRPLLRTLCAADLASARALYGPERVASDDSATKQNSDHHRLSENDEIAFELETHCQEDLLAATALEHDIPEGKSMRITREESPDQLAQFDHIKPAPIFGPLRCFARFPGTARTCTLSKSHDGPHVSHGLFKRVMAVWDEDR